MELCKPFIDKVDPDRDGAKGYFDIIKSPMDLTTIKKKLSGNKYASIEEWKHDVNQIWENAMVYNDEGTLLYLIAKEMKLWFNRKYIKIPINKDEDWILSLTKTSKKLYDLSLLPPSTIATFHPPTALPPIEVAQSPAEEIKQSIIILEIPPGIKEKYENYQVDYSDQNKF
ncbi:Bromodomain containing protein [Histomonas meleagridis]|nr:Bromodomain containing protein [Histomonas meleagridis]